MSFPPEVDALPEEAKRHFARVHKSAVNSGCTDPVAIAWSGLSNAGWTKTEKGWSRVEKLRQVIVKRRALAKRDTFTFNLPIVEIAKGSTDATAKAFGWASIALDDGGDIIVDHGEDDIPVPELEQAAYNLVKMAAAPETRGAAFADAMHEGPDVAQLIEACMFTPEKRVAMGLDGTGKAGFWIGYEVHDPATVAKVRSGELAEFSIFGDARRVPVGKRERGTLKDLVISKVSLVDRGEGKGVTIQLVKQRSESKLMKFLKNLAGFKKKADGSDPAAMLEEVLSSLSAEQRALVEMAIEAAAASGVKPGAEEAPPETPPVEAEKAEDEEKKPEVPAPEEETEKKKEDEMTPAIAKRLQDAETMLAKNNAELEKIRKERRREEFVKLAKKYEAMAGFSTDELAEMLDTLEGTLEKSRYAKLLKGLEQNAATMTGLLGSFGSSARGMDASESDPVVVKAKELQKDNKDLSYADAYAKAMKDPDVRGEVIKSFRKGEAE